jgi:hypothetical protein
MPTLPHTNHHPRKPADSRNKAKPTHRNPGNRRRQDRRRKNHTNTNKTTVHPPLRIPKRTLKQRKNPRRMHRLHRHSQLHAKSRKKPNKQLTPKINRRFEPQKNHGLSTQKQKVETRRATRTNNHQNSRFDTQRNHGLSTQTQGLTRQLEKPNTTITGCRPFDT